MFTIDAMKKQDAIRHYGSVRKLAKVLDISPQAVYLWKKDVPELQALKLEKLTRGELQA